MDTSAGPSMKRCLRADITHQYEERVASTTEKVDPIRAKARELLGEFDNFELEEVAGAFSAPDSHANETKVDYLEAPLMTLRELMPGSTGDGHDDSELDQSFHADKIEFLVMQQNMTDAELEADLLTADTNSHSKLWGNETNTRGKS